MRSEKVTFAAVGLLLLALTLVPLCGCSAKLAEFMQDPVGFVEDIQDSVEGVPPREPGEPAERGTQGDMIAWLIGLAAVAIGIPGGGAFYEGVLRPRRKMRENGKDG